MGGYAIDELTAFGIHVHRQLSFLQSETCFAVADKDWAPLGDAGRVPVQTLPLQCRLKAGTAVQKCRAVQAFGLHWSAEVQAVQAYGPHCSAEVQAV